MKISKIKNLMKQARVVAENSPDSETQVGALLIHGKTGAVLSSGFNGFIRGAPDDQLPKIRPKKYPYIMHAEQNLICNAARHGVSMDECFIVSTLSPCVHCLRLLFQCGVKQIYFEEKYRDFNKSSEMDDIEIAECTLYEGCHKISVSAKQT